MGDCTVRAICKALNADWEEMYAALSLYGFRLADMPSANHVWGAFLKEHGFKRQIVDRKGYGDIFEEVDLCEIVKDCKDELLVSAKQRNVTIAFDGESRVVRGSRDLLKELIENLSQNAIRYNNLGG